MLSNLVPGGVTAQVRAEQIRLLFHQGTTIQVLGIVTALVSVTMLWSVADHILLLIWLLVMVLVSLMRLAINYAFARAELPDDKTEKWGWIYTAGTFISGVVWGVLAFFYDPAWPAAYQVILFVIYTGITAGAFNTNTSLFVAFPAFYLPPVLCLMFVMLRQELTGFHALAMLFLIYIVLMYLSALKFHKRLANSLQIRFDNEQLAAELADSNQKLMELAEIDGLTKIYNRRYMDDYLKKEWNRHLRIQKPLSMLFVDIDYFKQYNDSYGHEGGDQCLMLVAHILQNNARRSNDIAARFGGEEFAVILPETETPDALAIAENMRSDLQRQKIPHASSTVSEYLTISIGIATVIPTSPDNARELRVCADKALYQAKKLGRDRVTIGYCEGELQSA